MQFNNAAADCQPQSGSRAGMLVSPAVELFENAFFIPLGKTGASVCNLDPETIAAVASRHGNFRARGSVTGSVFQKIRQHLMEQQLIEINQWQMIRKIDRKSMILEHARQTMDGAP